MRVVQSTNFAINLLIILLFFAATVSSYGSPCTANEDCDPLWEYCSVQDNNTRKCVHKEMFPMQSLEFLGSFFCIFVVMLANAGGLSSGVVLIPICLAFLKYDIRQSIALANIATLASSVMRLLMQGMKKQNEISIIT